VFENFLTEYKAGRTPNPDVLCNREIKFKAFLDYALGMGVDKIATGHYARITEDGHGYHLMQSQDQDKDQTYFLYMLNQKALSKSIFPLASLEKSTVRQLALNAGFPNHKKKDSTGICFIGERRFRDFLQTYLPANPGPIVTTEGNRIGEHQGLMYYTLGQRHGLGIGGMADGDEQPWYVINKELENNKLMVAQGHDHPLLFTSSLTATQIHWISGNPHAISFQCQARCRHRQPLQDCWVEVEDNQRLLVNFETPQRAITPGQSVVLYLDGECLGGGIIR